MLTSSYFGLASTRAPNSGTLSDLAKQMLAEKREETSVVKEQSDAKRAIAASNEVSLEDVESLPADLQETLARQRREAKKFQAQSPRKKSKGGAA